ncbi:unnamed protein product [Ilex paraguariensis]|uniref:High mobility group B protein 10 n=1 Tax=Ilex paraguariensis TaxID=185542 RepID=A0ABC8UI73_9AQUA
MSTHLGNDPITATTNASTENATDCPSQPPSQSESPYGQSHHSSRETKTYPKPEAEYQEIKQNPDVFFEKLQGFHTSFGTKFSVPTVAGKALDLHHLFVEVTSRGGIEKVIRDRKWKDVIVGLNPSTITSASFVLRKFYLSLLYHFEQAYYFRKEVPSISVADPASRVINGSEALHAFEGDAASPNLEPGSSVTGTIDAKFEYGYLITVSLGSDKLKGVLYHTPMALDMSKSHNSFVAPPQRRRKRHQLALRDPSRPKSNRSGYNFFFAEHYTRLKPMYHGQEKSITKKIGLLWNRLTEAEKKVYQEKGLRDKERYRTEMLEYQSSMHSQAQ